MKKLIIFLALCTIARAVGTVQQTTQQVGNTSIYTISLYWTGDAITGTVPVTLVQAQSIPIVQGYRVINMEAASGTPTPTNGYSIALLDTAGVDVLAGAASTVPSATPTSFVGSPTSAPIFGSISLSITGQSVAGAKGTIFIYLAPFSQVIGLAPTAPSFPAQGANLFYASPNGASGSPGFRAIAVPGDFGANVQGNASKVQLSTGVTVSGDCVKFDANGNTVDQGAPCNNFALPAGQQTQYLQIQPNTGNNTTTRFANLPVFNALDYNFPSQTNGTSLAVGNTTITMTPVPQGVNGADLYHRLYISGGTGTAEACLISGGTGTSGATSGSIILNCGNTHTGAYTIQSIDGGIQEAAQAATTAGGGIVIVPAGIYTSFAALQIQSNVIVEGVPGGTLLKAANQVLGRNPQWLNANAPASPGYYCMVCGAGGASNIVIRDITVDENGVNQTYSYFSGDVELYNTTASRIEGVTVQNRQGTLAGGGTGVGIGIYGTAANPPGSSINNGIYASTVDAHPAGCTVPNGGGGFYIEGEGTRIDHSYAKDYCDVGFVVAACNHCVVANSVADVGAGQMSTPSFSVEGSTNTEFIGDQCDATGTNNGRYCIGIDSATINGNTVQSSGTRVVGVSSSKHGTALEIGLQFALFGVALASLDTDVVDIHADNATNDCIVLNQYVIKVNITGGDLESCGGSGISIISVGTGAGTTVTNVIVNGLKSDHAVNAGVIANNTSGGTNPAVIGIKIINSFLGDTNGTPRQLRGVWFQTPATDVYIAGNTTTGVTSNPVLFQGALTNAFVGPNTTSDGSSMTTATNLGTAVASAATITAAQPIFHVTGTTTIATINGAGAAGTSTGMGSCITIIPDGLWATNTAGNIALASTAVVSKQLIMCFDSTTSKWYPSY